MEKPYFLTYRLPAVATQKYDVSMSKCLTCVFQTKIPLPDARFCMAVVGSIPQLGHWTRVYQAVATHQGDGVWQAKVDLPVNVEIEYKWVVYEKRFCRIVEYETGKNRRLRIDNASLFIEDYYDGVQTVKEVSVSDLASLGHDLTAISQREHKHQQLVQEFDDIGGLTKSVIDQSKDIRQHSCNELSQYNVYAVNALHGRVLELYAVNEATSSDVDGGLAIDDFTEQKALGVGRDDAGNGAVPLDNVRNTFNKNAEDILKVGLVTGVIFSAMLICRIHF